nr:Ring domain containing protein [Pandoravirus aubagnensis]
MDGGGLLWPAGPAPTENVDTCASRCVASPLRNTCRPVRWRREAGPVVARIDVTSDQDIVIECMGDDTADHDIGAVIDVLVSSAPRQPPPPPATRNNDTATPAHFHAHPHDDKRNRGAVHTTPSIFGPRLGVGSRHDALEDEDDDNTEMRLVRGRRRNRCTQTDRMTARAFRRRKQQQQRQVETSDMHEEPVPSAPSAALFDWDVFRLSLADASVSVPPSYDANPAAPPAIDSMPLTPLFDLPAAFANIALRCDPPRQTPLATTVLDVCALPVAVRSVDLPSNASTRSPETLTALPKHKPWAAPDDLVLIDREPHGHRTVATLLDFDGARYRVAVPCRDQSAPATTLSLSLTGLYAPSSGEHPNARWTNGQLNECAVCMDAEADTWFGCRCTVPVVCADCAHSIDTCPYCDTRLERPPARIERALAIVAADAPWITVPLRIVLDGVDTGRRAREIRAQVAWPGVLLRAAIGHMIGHHDMTKSRVLVGGRPLADQVALGAQGVSNGRLVCVIPRLRGD